MTAAAVAAIVHCFRYDCCFTYRRHHTILFYILRRAITEHTLSNEHVYFRERNKHILRSVRIRERSVDENKVCKCFRISISIVKTPNKRWRKRTRYGFVVVAVCCSIFFRFYRSACFSGTIDCSIDIFDWCR